MARVKRNTASLIAM